MKKIIHILSSCIFIFLFQFNLLKSVIILVHCSHFEDNSWYQNETKFHKKIEEYAMVVGQNVVDFGWGRCSTSLDYNSIIYAGSTLSFNILNRIAEGEKRIILVGFGLGQEVIKVASQYLNFAKKDCEVSCEPEEYELINKNFNNLKKQRDSLLRLWSDKYDFLQQKFWIDVVINLGIPKSTFEHFPSLKFRFVADTNVIGFFYNIYSDNVLWQDFVGSEKLLPVEHEKGRVNDALLTKIKGLEKSNRFCCFSSKKTNQTETYLETLAGLIFIIPGAVPHE